MSVTVVFEDVSATLAAEARGESLWVDAAGLAALGWSLRPEGFCRGALCTPIPPARRDEIVRADGAVDLVALAHLRGQGVAHDAERSLWVFGRSQDSARSLEAPDFVLPDLQGRRHRLADFRGRKVLLNAWASW
jgi:hypothetical protein